MDVLCFHFLSIFYKVFHECYAGGCCRSLLHAVRVMPGSNKCVLPVRLLWFIKCSLVAVRLYGDGGGAVSLSRIWRILSVCDIADYKYWTLSMTSWELQMFAACLAGSDLRNVTRWCISLPPVTFLFTTTVKEQLAWKVVVGVM